MNHPYFEGLKEEFGVVEDFKESRPKSAAISQPAPSAPSGMLHLWCCWSCVYL